MKARKESFFVEDEIDLSSLLFLGINGGVPYIKSTNRQDF